MWRRWACRFNRRVLRAWHSRARRWLPGGYPGMEKWLGLIHLGEQELTPAHEAELAFKAGVRFDLGEANAEIVWCGVAFQGVGDEARPRSVAAHARPA